MKKREDEDCESAAIAIDDIADNEDRNFKAEKQSMENRRGGFKIVGNIGSRVVF